MGIASRTKWNRRRTLIASGEPRGKKLSRTIRKQAKLKEGANVR